MYGFGSNSREVTKSNLSENINCMTPRISASKCTKQQIK